MALAVLPSGLLEAPLTPALLFNGCSLVVVVDDSFRVVDVFGSLVCLDVVREEVRVTFELDELNPVAGGAEAFEDKPGTKGVNFDLIVSREYQKQDRCSNLFTD